MYMYMKRNISIYIFFKLLIHTCNIYIYHILCPEILCLFVLKLQRRIIVKLEYNFEDQWFQWFKTKCKIKSTLSWKELTEGAREGLASFVGGSFSLGFDLLLHGEATSKWLDGHANQSINKIGTVLVLESCKSLDGCLFCFLSKLCWNRSTDWQCHYQTQPLKTDKPVPPVRRRTPSLVSGVRRTDSEWCWTPRHSIDMFRSESW